MKITYLILAHRYPEQLFRLVDRLNDSGVNFLIHVDKKVEQQLYDRITDHFKSMTNVFFIDRFKCYWAGFGIAQATFQGLKEALDRKISFDYLCLMSGQDYPIKTNEYIKSYLERHTGKSFINTRPFPNPLWTLHDGGFDRIHNWYYINGKNQYGFPHKLFSSRPTLTGIISKTLGKLIPKRKFPAAYKPYGGAQFWALYKTHVSYVVNNIAENPDYFNFFKHVMVPDEILFQTIMGNHPRIQEEAVDDTLHFLEWDRKGATLTMEDKENIANTYHLFARKFDTNVDGEIMDWIDEQILSK
jgi:hypothetical protein